MGRLALITSVFFWASALLWYVLMAGALITDSGDYKYDAIMGTLSLILALSALNLSRRN